MKDRAEVQEDLKGALRIVNKRFEEEIPAKFMVIRGDSFQGMLSSPKYLFDIYYAFFENIGRQFYLGIGVGSLLNFMADVMWNWTERQREIVTYYRKGKNEKSSATLEEVAEDIGIKKQTLSKILKRSKYKLLKEAEDTFVDFINRNWLTEGYKPKMTDKEVMVK